MNTLVVLFALVSAACGSYIAQPPHHPAVVLDPHRRPLDTAEVIRARALHFQAKALEGKHYGHYAPLAHSLVIPAVYSHHAYGIGHGHGHFLKKRSLGHYGYAHAFLPGAVSYQSRVDHLAPIAHTYPHYAPLAYSTGFLHSAPLLHSHGYGWGHHSW